MITSKTAFAAAAFGAVALIAPVEAGEIKYNFTGEFTKSVAADSRNGERSQGGVPDDIQYVAAGPQTEEAGVGHRPLTSGTVVGRYVRPEAQRSREWLGPGPKPYGYDRCPSCYTRARP